MRNGTSYAFWTVACIVGVSALEFARASFAANIVQTPSPIIVDGDTVRASGVTYRLVGFDTPETYRARCAQELALGLKAKDRLSALSRENGGLRLKTSGKTDKYARTLATAFAGDQAVGAVLISEGLARPYRGGKRQPWCEEEES